MKKFTLAVAQPCHENWEGMLPEEKGRFCASCKKTVVDFTGMSDRQMADYFQNPAGSLCGRFYKDQLNRPISISGKKKVLPSHFFRYTWPAFLLLLKSCDQREEIVGDLAVEAVSSTDIITTMGMALPEITPIDSSFAGFQKPVSTECHSIREPDGGQLLGDTTIFVLPDDKEDFSPTVDTSFLAIDSAVVDVDQLKIAAGSGKNEILMGAVAVSTCTTVAENKADPKISSITKSEKLTVVVYPNPLPQGQSLNLQIKQAFRGIFQLCAISGQVLQTGSVTAGKDQRLSIPVPHLPSGVYLIRLADNAAKTILSEKFIIQ